MRRVIHLWFKQAVIRLLPPGNRPGHEDTPANLGGSALWMARRRRAAPREAHREIPHSAGSGGHDRRG